jgi:hypothetical protein
MPYGIRARNNAKGSLKKTEKPQKAQSLRKGGID